MSQLAWQHDIATATAASKESGRPLLVDFYSETCLGCEKMGLVTYVDASIIAFVNARFVPVKLNVSRPTPAMRDLLRMAKPLFTPLLLFLDVSGAEIRRFTGYLPPADFQSELEFVLAWSAQLHGRFEEAYHGFRAISDRSPGSHVAAEALYWAGIAGYRWNGQGLDGLLPEWALLRDRYPGSTWWVRASCVADRIAAGMAAEVGAA